MSPRRKNVGWVMLAAVFLAASPSAFATGGGEGTAGGAAQAVTMVVRDNYPSVPFQDYSIAYIEKKTNTKLTLIRILPNELQEKLNLLLAGGDRPDIVQFYADDFEYKLVDADLLLPLNDILNTKAPNLKKQWGDVIWKSMTHPEDGKIYAIPAEKVYTDIHFVTLYRQDWLDKLRLQVPKTVDDYYNVALAVSKRDPDGNGKDDTYAFSGFLGYRGTRYFDHIFSAYGTHFEQWLDVGGKIVNGNVLPGAKEALKMMNRLYNAGVIDPEFITDDEQRTVQKYQKGVYGATNNYIFMMDSPTNKYYTEFKQNNPNGSWTQATTPLTSTFTNKPLGQRMLGQRGWLKTALVKGAKNPDGAARIIDWYATEDGALFYNFGIPGEDFRVESNGAITMLTPANEWQARSVQQIWLIGLDLAEKTATSAYVSAVKLSRPGAVPSSIDGVIVPQLAKYQDDLNIFSREQFLKMTVGEIPVEGGFEDFVAAWNQRGGKELTDALNKKAGR